MTETTLRLIQLDIRPINEIRPERGNAQKVVLSVSTRNNGIILSYWDCNNTQ